MLELGNEVNNGVYEASIPDGNQKPTPASSRLVYLDFLSAVGTCGFSQVIVDFCLTVMLREYRLYFCGKEVFL